MEEWRFVNDFEHYEVSNLGRVRSWRRGGNSPHMLKTNLDRNNYLTVSLSSKTRSTRCYVHTLVAKAFLGDYSKQYRVNYIDGDRRNVQLKNLMLVPYYSSKVSLKIVETGEVFKFSKDLAKHLNVSVSAVSYAITGRYGKSASYMIKGVRIQRVNYKT